MKLPTYLWRWVVGCLDHNNKAWDTNNILIITLEATLGRYMNMIINVCLALIGAYEKSCRLGKNMDMMVGCVRPRVRWVSYTRLLLYSLLLSDCSEYRYTGSFRWRPTPRLDHAMVHCQYSHYIIAMIWDQCARDSCTVRCPCLMTASSCCYHRLYMATVVTLGWWSSRHFAAASNIIFRNFRSVNALLSIIRTLRLTWTQSLRDIFYFYTILSWD